MDKEEAQQVFDGVILSDGALILPRWCDNAYFDMGLSGDSHLDWLYYVKDALLTLDTEVSSIYPKVNAKGSRSRLCSRVSAFLTEQYYRWYPSGHKRVPEDLTIAPASLANWFMGDGSSTPFSGSPNRVRVHFGTEGFTRSDVERLSVLLGYIGIESKSYSVSTYGPGLWVFRIRSVRLLMDIVESYILPSYQYKVKKPWRIR